MDITHFILSKILELQKRIIELEKDNLHHKEHAEALVILNQQIIMEIKSRELEVNNKEGILIV